jgi:hypothetical protein
VSRWPSGCRLLMVAFVALSCSDCGANAYALCDGCPDLFASIPIAQQGPPAQPRVQSARLHGRDVNHPRQKRRDNSPPPSLTCCSPLTAFAQEWIFKNTGPTPSAFSEPAPGMADEEMLPTPALRIDRLFNTMAAGPSDEPEDTAALRADMLSQFPMRQASPGPDNRYGLLVPTVIAFGGGLLLVGLVLLPARRHCFAPPREPPDRARRFTRLMRGNLLVGPTPSRAS